MTIVAEANALNIALVVKGRLIALSNHFSVDPVAFVLENSSLHSHRSRSMWFVFEHRTRINIFLNVVDMLLNLLHLLIKQFHRLKPLKCRRSDGFVLPKLIKSSEPFVLDVVEKASAHWHQLIKQRHRSEEVLLKVFHALVKFLHAPIHVLKGIRNEI